ncbi:hypothetical protein [Streptomyces sp. RKAG337]|uniref:hypothetical protein n=1 Tax=Streptomyces sp. RKAG337 TaxID=2893404 RepID=UPI0020348EAC|nr:hypothetical protein [Streptomyces sp. RKAG337]MCM2427833.1 hypothetical protein [Streptomyces sp. RKAG337]
MEEVGARQQPLPRAAGTASVGEDPASHTEGSQLADGRDAVLAEVGEGVAIAGRGSGTGSP